MPNPDTTGSCFCELCRFRRQVALVRNYGNASAKRALIDDLYERLACAEFDNNYWAAVADGSWPGARQAAANIIARCDALEKEQPS